MEIVVKVVQFILSLSIFVLLHEFGHFMMAKIFKTRVEKFYIFFNPWFSLFKFKKGDTEYGMGWLPLGGYVKISGMIDESMDIAQMKEPPKPYEFRAKPAWQRLLIMLGGVLVNFILAFFIYIMILFAWGEKYLPAENVKYGVVCDSLFTDVGMQTGDIVLSLDNQKLERFSDIIPTILLESPKTMQVLRDGQLVNIDLPSSLVKNLLTYSSKGFAHKMLIEPRYPYSGEIVGFAEESPAKNAGIVVSDRFLRLNGETFTYYDEYTKIIRSHKNDTLQAEILRGTDTLTVAIPVGADGIIGVGVKIDPAFDYAVKYYSFFEAIPAGIRMGIDQISSYLKQFKLFKNPEALKSVGGFLSIGNIFPGYWDWQAFWSLTALLSIILGVMNLLPIPALDGGHVVFLLYEVITRRKPNEKFLENAQIAGMIFLLLLLVLANTNDILKLFH